MKTFEKTYIIGNQRQEDLTNKGYMLKTFDLHDDPQQWALDKQEKGYDVILGKTTTSVKGYHKYIGFYKKKKEK